MRIFLTGAAGMLGTELALQLEADTDIELFKFTRKELNLLDRSAVFNEIAHLRPDLVVHAAAQVGGIQANMSTPIGFLINNLEMDMSVINASLASKVPSLLYIGSSCMYPKDFRQPLVEADLLQGPLEETNEGYALAKIVGSKLCDYISNEHGYSYRTIIPSNLYGPGDNFDPGRSHLLASVIRKVLEARASNAESIEVWGSGTARREFTFARDLAHWIVNSISRISEFPSRLNVGSGRDLEVSEYYRLTMSIVGYESQLSFDMSKPDGMMAKLMDSSVARREFGWNPTTSLESGIEQTYKWLEESSGIND